MFSPRKSGRPFQAFDWFRVWLSLPLGPGHQEAGGALQVPQGQAHLSQLALWGQAVRLLPLWRLSGHLQHTRRPREVGKAGSPIVFFVKVSHFRLCWEMKIYCQPSLTRCGRTKARRLKANLCPRLRRCKQNKQEYFWCKQNKQDYFKCNQKKQEYFKCKHNKQE